MKSLPSVVWLALVALCCARAHAASDDARMVSVTVDVPGDSQRVVQGRILSGTPNGGILVEDRAGRIHSVAAAATDSRADLETPFSYLGSEELGRLLMKQMGVSFRIHETRHFVVCSQAGDLYTKYTGELLESVFEQFREFFEGAELQLSELPYKLPVIVFRDPSMLREHALRHHPESDLSTVPGYYSIRDNQMLTSSTLGGQEFGSRSEMLRKIRKDRRQVETTVHEVVHQLAYNTGLQVRYADNPIWLSEGLAVYFESTSGRSTLGWVRPGESSRTHLPTLKTQRALATLPLPIPTLLSSNNAFLTSETGAAAYAQSWVLVHFLATRNKTGLSRLLRRYQTAEPMIPIGAENHLRIFREAVGIEPDDLERQLLSYAKRLRTPR